MKLSELRKQVKLSEVGAVVIDFAEGQVDYSVELRHSELTPEQRLLNVVFEIDQKFLNKLNDCEVKEISLDDGIIFLTRTDSNIITLFEASKEFRNFGYKFNLEKNYD